MTKNKNIFENNIFDIKYISKKLVSPCRDWLILVILLFIMIVSSVVFDILTYQKIVKGEMYVSVEKDELTLIKLEREKLKAIVDDFEIKKEYISKIKIESLIDPSI